MRGPRTEKPAALRGGLFLFIANFRGMPGRLSVFGHERSFDIIGEIAENPPKMTAIQTRIRCASVESAQGPTAIQQEALCQISRGNRWIFLKHLKSFR